MLSQVCFFLFIIVDGIFVGNGVGVDALGAVNLVMPFVMVVNALFMLVTIGGVTVVAIRLGREDKKGANLTFMHAFVLILALSTVLAILGTCLTEPIARMLGANATYMGYVKDYLFCYSLFIIPSAVSMLLQGICRNDGAPTLVMAAVISTVALNVFLDWLFVFPLKMGIKGAAIATGISQSVCLIIVLFHFFLKKGSLHFSKFRPSAKLFGKIAARGVPEMISQLAIPIATLCMNHVLLAHMGEIAINSFSIISYITSFSMAVFIGVAEGAQPLFGNSYGEKNDADLKYYFRMGLILNVVSSTVVFALLLFVGGPVSKIFGADEQTVAFTINALPKFGWGFILMSVNLIISSYLYSTKRTLYAVVQNVLRSIVFSIVCIFSLPAIFGSVIIWFSFGIYEGLSMIAAIILLKISERKGIVYR